MGTRGLRKDVVQIGMAGRGKGRGGGIARTIRNRRLLLSVQSSVNRQSLPQCRYVPLLRIRRRATFCGGGGSDTGCCGTGGDLPPLVFRNDPTPTSPPPPRDAVLTDQRRFKKGRRQVFIGRRGVGPRGIAMFQHRRLQHRQRRRSNTSGCRCHNTKDDDKANTESGFTPTATPQYRGWRLIPTVMG